MVDRSPTKDTDGSTDVTGLREGVGRRRYLELAGLVTSGALAGCTGGPGDDNPGTSGNNGNDSSGNTGNDSGGSDPFSSVEADSQTITATIRRETTVDAVKVVDPSGQKRLEVEVMRGSAEIPVSTVGDCGSCDEFEVRLPDGEYELVAIRIPDDDARRPTEVGRRAISVERTARISGIEMADGELAVTVENTGSFLIRMQALRYEAIDPATDDAGEFYSRERKRTRVGIERTDSPDHELRKTEGRPVLEHIVLPGSNGTFEMGSPRLYRTEEVTEETACTDQSVDLQFEVLGQGEDVRAAAAGTMKFTGDVEEAGDESFACKESQIDNVSSAETE